MVVVLIVWVPQGDDTKVVEDLLEFEQKLAGRIDGLVVDVSFEVTEGVWIKDWCGTNKKWALFK